MTEEESKALASQLRKPEGEMGLQVGERMNHGNQFMNRNTIEELDLSPGDEVLEIGMGNGYFVKEIFEKYGEVVYTGCDFSPLMVEESIKMNTNTKNVHFYHCTADQLPVKDQSMDCIFTINTLYFWEEPAKVLAEIKRVLKPGGKLLITIRPKEYIQQFEFTKYGFNMYSGEDAKNLLKKNGFNVVDIQTKIDPPIDSFGVRLEPVSLIIISTPV